MRWSSYYRGRRFCIYEIICLNLNECNLHFTRINIKIINRVQYATLCNSTFLITTLIVTAVLVLRYHRILF